MKLVLVLTIVCAACAAAAPKSIPAFVPICHRSAPDFDACILKASETLRPKLARGIPELRVPSLEPLVVPEVHLEQGTRAVNFNCTLRNVEVYGLTDFYFLSETADVVNKLQIAGRVRIPNLRLESDYDIDGRILLVPLKGKGRFHANFTNSVADVTLNGKFIMKKGTKYYQTDETRVKLLVDGAMLNFENLFNGDSTLGRTTNTFINENSKDIIQEITPVVETVTAHVVQDLSNKVFSSFPYDQLFPV